MATIKGMQRRWLKGQLKRVQGDQSMVSDTERIEARRESDQAVDSALQAQSAILNQQAMSRSAGGPILAGEGQAAIGAAGKAAASAAAQGAVQTNSLMNALDEKRREQALGYASQYRQLGQQDRQLRQNAIKMGLESAMFLAETFNMGGMPSGGA